MTMNIPVWVIALFVSILWRGSLGKAIHQDLTYYNSSPSISTNFSTIIFNYQPLPADTKNYPSRYNVYRSAERLNDNQSQSDTPIITILENQTCSDSSEDFPHVFSVEELRSWAIIPVILVGIYCFTILAIICDKYFLPCMEILCDVFNLTQDVAAATFMSIATSTPELFVNIIGTFITESDLGVGTIVGSSLFNALGVAAIGGLAASQPIQLDWWPLTRDVIIYICAVFLLVLITWDGYIFWYEGFILFVVYFLYFTVMYNNTRISNYISKFLPKRNDQTSDCDEASIKKDSISTSDRKVSTVSPYGSYMEDAHHRQSQQNFKNFQSTTLSTIQIKDHEKGMATIEEKNEEKTNDEDELPWFVFPKDASTTVKCLWVYLFPIKCFLHIFLPDPRKHPNLYPLIFVMCIVSIGINSYVVSWMITLIGTTFRIPDAVLGFTFLAAGGCLPESISITIMSRRGEGSMGVSNSLGANTMNILMSLGLPWFLKTIMMGTNKNSFIRIESGIIEYTIVALIGVAVVLFITLYLNKFQLRKRVGVILSLVYFVCISLAIVSELLTREHC
ncbi:sodium/potassium/calcium exchanger 5-like [Coccinella septempunctata]|uniref:sodium/potassium/calcium exchanger 5-like n=1 Tax=Coccinella septempunctata TaxID=41139 RepID=UPI001D05E763|nr:sodium/potassium/calcium exchanger 5-like [Coccinella septempunctata]